MSVLLFFHNDNDGWCSGAVAYRELKSRYDEDIICFEMDYGISLPKQLPDDVSKIFVLDYSFNASEWAELIQKYGRENITWIDHHISSIKKYKEYEDLDGIRTEDWSGAMLTWKYFHPNGDIVPYVVRLVDDYDRWQMKMGTKSLDFYEYTQRLELADVTAPIWTTLLDSLEMFVEEWIEVGKSDKERKIRDIKKVINELGVHITVRWRDNEYSCLKINSSLIKATSQMGAIIYEDMGKDLAWMYYEKKNENGDLVRINQLRSTKIDVSKLATEHGGGGHPNAAGFTEILKKGVYNCVELL